MEDENGLICKFGLSHKFVFQKKLRVLVVEDNSFS